ncbi:MAG TPA: restriction endonuclease [Pyrinomonadaceae bacterium]
MSLDITSENNVGKGKRIYYSFGATGLTTLEHSVFFEQERMVQDVCDNLGITLFNPLKFTIPHDEPSPTPEIIYEISKKQIKESDVVILNCSYPSYWVGQTLEIASIFNIPAVLIAPNYIAIPRTIRGSQTLKYEIQFNSLEELKADLTGVLRLAFKTSEFQNETQDANPDGLVNVVSTINIELINYLKRNPEILYSIDPRQFEELIAELLAGFGWKVELTPKIKDGGYDIFAISKNVAPGINSAWIIECKRYSPENKVGVEIVRALYGV